MNKREIKKWFSSRNYTLEFNAVEPVFRNKKVYAVASPSNGGGWCSFSNVAEVIRYISEQENICR